MRFNGSVTGTEADHFMLLLVQRLRLRGATGTPGRRLVAAVRDLVEAGALPLGTRLPSERQLAPAVGMSRGTVAAAYRVLVDEGLCERRHGSGTYLTGSPADTGALGHLMRDDAMVIDLSKSIVPDASHLRVSSIDPADLLRASSQHGYDVAGDARLRAALRGGAFRRAAPSTGDFLVTSGGQQGIDLAARCVVAPRDTVLVEETTYPGALAALRRRGAQPVPVRCDENGPEPGAFRDAIDRHRPSCAYLVSVHSPSGRVTTAERTGAIAAIARAADLVLIEDRTLAELVYGVPSPRHYAEGYPDGTITIGSLSKVLWGGLRVGWIAAAAPLLARITEVKLEVDLATGTVGQRMAAALLETTSIDDWRAELERRRDRMAGALRDALPSWNWRTPDGGLSLWVRLPGTDTDRFAETARAHGVTIAAGSLFSARRGHRDHLRLSFAVAPELADRAIAALAAAWEDRNGGRRSGQPRPDLTV